MTAVFLAAPPPPPDRTTALEAFLADVMAEYWAGGHITRAEVWAAYARYEQAVQ